MRQAISIQAKPTLFLNMSQTRSLAGSTLLALGGSVAAGTLHSCPNDSPLSCHNSTAADTCCLVYPGGQLLQTQFWDTDPSTGPVDSWTIHGLWPDECSGSYQSNCDPSRAYTNISQILQSFKATDLLSYMNSYWLDINGDDESFWAHEWGKHATCISTLDPTCYDDYTPQQEVPDFFNRAVSLFQGLPTYKWLSAAGITPSSDTKYSVDDIQGALQKAHGAPVTLVCDSGALNEVHYGFNVRGTVQEGQFVAADAPSDDSCSSQISYLPKSGGGGGSSPSSSPSPSSPSPTSSSSPSPAPPGAGDPFTGNGYLNVVSSDGQQNGCLISGG